MSYKLTPFARVALGVMIIGAAGTATYMLSIKQMERSTVTQAVIQEVPSPQAAPESKVDQPKNSLSDTVPQKERVFDEKVTLPEPSQDRAMDALSNMRSLSNK